MLKKAALAVFGLALAIGLASPSKAQAEVHVGIAFGAPVAYGAVVVPPAPYVAYGQPGYTPYYDSDDAPYYVTTPAYPAYGAGYYYGGYYGGDHDRWEHGDHDRGYWRGGNGDEHHGRREGR